jgi:hypothetical protein
MGLPDHSEATVPQAVDEVKPPQRPVALERLCQEPARQRPQFGWAARRIGLSRPNVVGEVKFLVIDPNRVVKPSGRAEHASAEAGQLIQSPRDVLPQDIDRGWFSLDKQGPTNVHRSHIGFDSQKRLVKRGQAIDRHIRHLLVGA